MFFFPNLFPMGNPLFRPSIVILGGVLKQIQDNQLQGEAQHEIAKVTHITWLSRGQNMRDI